MKVGGREEGREGEKEEEKEREGRREGEGRAKREGVAMNHKGLGKRTS